MLSSLQPQRPKAPPQPLRPPMNQQPNRQTSSQTLQPDHGHTHPPSSTTTNEAQVNRAMPPPSPQPQPLPLTTYNPAALHPVFFTPHWRRPPFPVSFNAAGFSPVAAGYVFASGQKEKGGVTKL